MKRFHIQNKETLGMFAPQGESLEHIYGVDENGKLKAPSEWGEYEIIKEQDLRSFWRKVKDIFKRK